MIWHRLVSKYNTVRGTPNDKPSFLYLTRILDDACAGTQRAMRLKLCPSDPNAQLVIYFQTYKR